VQPIFKADPEKLQALYNSGMTQTELAAHYGVTQKAIWGFMRRHGIKARIAAKRDQKGSKNSSWVGDKISYKGAHNRVEAERGTPKFCEVCGSSDSTKRYEWASLTKNYSDVMDYKRMCKTCHVNFDKLMHPRRRLSESQALYVKEQIKSGRKQSEIADELGVKRTLINHIKANRSYKEVGN